MNLSSVAGRKTVVVLVMRHCVGTSRTSWRFSSLKIQLWKFAGVGEMTISPR